MCKWVCGVGGVHGKAPNCPHTLIRPLLIDF